METFKGTVRYHNIEGGVWIIETEKGDTYQLHGGPEELYMEGKKVTVKGTVPRDIMSTGMMAPTLKVEKIV